MKGRSQPCKGPGVVRLGRVLVDGQSEVTSGESKDIDAPSMAISIIAQYELTF